MTDWRDLEDPEQAMNALFTDVLETAWPGDWAEQLGRPAPGEALGDGARAQRPPVIRLTPERHASIVQPPGITILPTVPAAPREVVEPDRWARHRSTVARVAAAVVIVAGIGWAGRLLLDRLDGDSVELDAAADLVDASQTSTTADRSTAPTSTAPTPSTTGATAVLRSSAATALSVTTTEAPPTTVVAAPATAAPTTAAPTTTRRPTTSPTTAVTTAPTTTATTVPTTAVTTVPTTPTTKLTTTTTEPTTTTAEPTTVPPPADVRIRNLGVSNITTTSAVVSFTTADCAGVAYDVSRDADRGARGLPGSDECWTQHSIVIGSANPLRPDTGYRVTVATFGRDGSSDKATVRFRTDESDDD